MHTVRSEVVPDVLLITPDIFEDERGFFLESYHHQKYREFGVQMDFVQDNHSYSRQGTIRGLHYQLRKPQAKLCRVVQGEVLDVALDIRVGSPTFGKFATAYLSAANRCQIYIPKGFAHGFAVLSSSAEFLYKCSDYFDTSDDHGVLWNDPQLGIDWAVPTPILSSKDRGYGCLRDIPESELPRYD